MNGEYDDGAHWLLGRRASLTVTEYALLRGISRQAVLARIRRGTLKAQRVGSFWIIDRTQLENEPKA